MELSKALRRGQRLEAENRLLRAEGGPSLIAESPSMQPVLQLIARVGPVRRERSDHGRTGHRQGSGGADAARDFRARRTSRW